MSAALVSLEAMKAVNLMASIGPFDDKMVILITYPF